MGTNDAYPTKRERMETRIQKREEWAASQQQKAEQAYTQSSEMLGMIPVGQPILVGHHSERYHRNTLYRSDNAMRKAYDAKTKADRHIRVAQTLRKQLRDSIYADDPDIVQRLEERIVKLETERDRCKAVNVWLRKRMGSRSNKVRGIVDVGKAKRAAAVLSEAATEFGWSSKQTQDMVDNIRFANTIGYPTSVVAKLSAQLRVTRQRLDNVTRSGSCAGLDGNGDI